MAGYRVLSRSVAGEFRIRGEEVGGGAVIARRTRTKVGVPSVFVAKQNPASRVISLFRFCRFLRKPLALVAHGQLYLRETGSEIMCPPRRPPSSAPSTLIGRRALKFSESLSRKEHRSAESYSSVPPISRRREFMTARDSGEFRETGLAEVETTPKRGRNSLRGDDTGEVVPVILCCRSGRRAI